MSRIRDHHRVFVDCREGWRVLLTAGRVDTQRFRDAQRDDRIDAEMMLVAFNDAVIDLEDIAGDLGIPFGEDVSVCGSAFAGSLQAIRRLSAEPALEQVFALEKEFDRLLGEHFALAGRGPRV
ncbi:hypothetical protein [Mesorhizobium sp. A623]